MIDFQHVTKRYFSKTALEDVSFTLPKGKIIGIIGENGSGKSTMLKLMAGLIRPTNGAVRINGEKAGQHTCKTVAYLSELDAYYPFFTVQDHINFFASQFFDFNIEKANNMLDFMKLNPKAKVRALSKGNRGRLKIILAMAREVPIILMDEPLSGLDPLVRESITKGLISFVDLERQTVIITTHEIMEIETLLDTVLLVKGGRVLAIQEVEELRIEKNMKILDWMKEVSN